LSPWHWLIRLTVLSIFSSYIRREAEKDPGVGVGAFLGFLFMLAVALFACAG
jgi:hypothetical protein